MQTHLRFMHVLHLAGFILRFMHVPFAGLILPAQFCAQGIQSVLAFGRNTLFRQTFGAYRAEIKRSRLLYLKIDYVSKFF